MLKNILLPSITILSGLRTVTMFCTIGVDGVVGTRVPPHPNLTSTSQSFTFAELLDLFALGISLTALSIGPLMYHIPHVPIGNPYGKIAVEFIAGLCERRWKLEGPASSEGWAPRGWRWDECFCLLRYTDDVLVASNLLCPCCMENLLK